MFIFIFFPNMIFGNLRSRQKVVHQWGKILLKLTKTDVHPINLDQLAKISNQPLIIVANHESWMDIPLLAGYLPIRFCFLAKESLFRIPLVGMILKSAGYISVTNNDTKKAQALFKRSHQVLKEYDSILIFTEGTRSLPHQEILPFKSGAFILALRSRATLLPVIIYGTKNIIPAKQERRVQRIFCGQKAVLKILSPLKFAQFKDKAHSELKEKVREQLKREYLTIAKKFDESKKMPPPRSSVDRAMVS